MTPHTPVPPFDCWVQVDEDHQKEQKGMPTLAEAKTWMAMNLSNSLAGDRWTITDSEDFLICASSDIREIYEEAGSPKA